MLVAGRATNIRLVLTDCDGVLTDGGVYYSDRGEEMKRFSMRDGMGVARLRAAGIDVGIVTGEVSGPVRRRAQKLNITELWEGIADKETALTEICSRRNLDPTEIGYMGDDHNDLSVMTAVGLAAAPSDALPAVLSVAHVVTSERGGYGAFRAFAEMIISAREHATEGAERWTMV